MVRSLPFSSYSMLTLVVTGLIGNQFLLATNVPSLSYSQGPASWGSCNPRRDWHSVWQETAHFWSKCWVHRCPREAIRKCYECIRKTTRAGSSQSILIDHSFVTDLSFIIHRDHGIRIGLKIFSPSGLLPPINPSVQSIIQNSRN